MTASRIPETDSGIQGEFNVDIYNQFQRNMRDKGFIETKEIIRSGIDYGLALEIGPGPGYLGLEWLKQTAGTQLKTLEISPAMIVVARQNAEAYELEHRWDVEEGSGEKIPIETGAFDSVFSCGSLHEWSQPEKTFDEIMRVLKPGGKFFIGDLRRDIFWPVKWLMRMLSKPKEIRPGFDTSVRAAYTPREISALLTDTAVKDYTVKSNPFGLNITGLKK